MASIQDHYRSELRPLLYDALQSGNLRTWSGGVLTASGRRIDDRHKDEAILALEGYLIEHNNLPYVALNEDLINAFADELRDVCRDEAVSLRINYNGVACLLEAWRYLAQTLSDPGDPQIILPACAAIGTGVHAVAFLAAAAGVHILMDLADYDLWPVRDALVMGVQRMLADDWGRTFYELRRFVRIGDVQQHAVLVQAVADADLLRERPHALDGLDLHHAVLAAYRRLAAPRRYGVQARILSVTLIDTIGMLLLAERRAGFALARAWLAWGDMDIQQIIRESIADQPLASFEEAVFLRQSFSS
jgi:hypothetical protein